MNIIVFIRKYQIVPSNKARPPPGSIGNESNLQDTPLQQTRTDLMCWCILCWSRQSDRVLSVAMVIDLPVLVLSPPSHTPTYTMHSSSSLPVVLYCSFLCQLLAFFYLDSVDLRRLKVASHRHCCYSATVASADSPSFESSSTNDPQMV